MHFFKMRFVMTNKKNKKSLKLKNFLPLQKKDLFKSSENVSKSAHRAQDSKDSPAFLFDSLSPRFLMSADFMPLSTETGCESADFLQRASEFFRRILANLFEGVLAGGPTQLQQSLAIDRPRGRKPRLRIPVGCSQSPPPSISRVPKGLAARSGSARGLPSP